MKTIWTCWDCHKEFEGFWTNEAGTMARDCIYCKGTAVSSYEHAEEDGVLMIVEDTEIQKS